MATNMPRARIFSRRTMPGPFYHLAVWKYHHITGELEFMWFLPSKQYTAELLFNAYKAVRSGVDPRLIEDCQKAVDGRLEELARKENGEHLKDMAIFTNKPITKDMPVWRG